MLSHTQAKQLVDSLGVTPAESLYMRVVSLFESSYGSGWKKPAGHTGPWPTHNMGAITTNHPDALSFRYGDTNPDAGAYVTWFAGDVNDLEGFRRLKNTLLKDNVQAALSNDDWMQATQAQYNNGYFMGKHTHTTAEGNEANVDDYYAELADAAHRITAETGERDPYPLVITERAEEGT